MVGGEGGGGKQFQFLLVALCVHNSKTINGSSLQAFFIIEAGECDISAKKPFLHTGLPIKESSIIN